MEKLSMHVRARYLGKAQAYQSLGFSEYQVKVAFVQEGIPEYHADELVKEAFCGAIGTAVRGGLTAAKALGSSGLLSGAKALGRGATAAGKWAGKGISRGGTLGKVQGSIGVNAGKAAKGISTGMKDFAANPGATAWQGAKNFGNGALFMGGKGVAANAGKATFAGSMVAPMVL